MNRPCPPAHERWLEELVVSGPGALSEDARAEIERCPRCALELLELTRVRASLEDAAGSEREALALAARRAGAAEERRMREAFEQRVAPALERTSAPRRRGRLGPVFLGALALAAAVLLVLRLARREPGPPHEGGPDVLLGGGRVEIETPEGEVAAFDTFRWQDRRDEGGGYRVQVWSAAEGAAPVRLLEERVEGRALTLDAARTRDWPARIAWTVEALDASRRVVPGASDSAEAWRPSAETSR